MPRQTNDNFLHLIESFLSIFSPCRYEDLFQLRIFKEDFDKIDRIPKSSFHLEWLASRKSMTNSIQEVTWTNRTQVLNCLCSWRSCKFTQEVKTTKVVDEMSVNWIGRQSLESIRHWTANRGLYPPNLKWFQNWKETYVEDVEGQSSDIYVF